MTALLILVMLGNGKAISVTEFEDLDMCKRFATAWNEREALRGEALCYDPKTNTFSK